jgi:hypothetical protein
MCHRLGWYVHGCTIVDIFIAHYILCADLTDKSPLALFCSTTFCRLLFYAYLEWQLWNYLMHLYLKAYLA